MRVALGLGVALVAALAADPQQPQPVPPGVIRAGQYRLMGVVGAPAPPDSAMGSPGPVYDVGPFPLIPPDLPPGEGHDVTVALCSVCHSLRYLTMQPPLPPEAWAATVRKMVEVHGAPIPQDAADRITGYLQHHF